MAAANIASTGIVLEVLTKDNYLDWSALVKNYLIGKDLWDNIVEGNLNHNHSDWKSKNGQALHVIQLSCGHYNLHRIRNCVTAQEAWSHLKEVFSEDLKTDKHDIEQGTLQTDIDMFHRALKKGLWWEEAQDYIKRHGVDIISQKSSSSSSKGWTSLHVAVNTGHYGIIEELLKMGALLTQKDSEGYTPFALAVESNYDIQIVEWMLNEGGNDLLTMKINSDDGKGDIPVLLAAIKGHKDMTRFLFSKTPWSTLLDNNGYYGAKLLSHCIHAEIFDVAAKLLQHDDGIQIPLSYESDECMRPIHALAHIPTAFLSGTRLKYFEPIIYNGLIIPLNREGKIITIESQEESQESITTGITKIYEIKKKHYLVREILRCLCERIEKISLESELHEWSVHDAMLQAAKYGIVEFIDSMRIANPDLLLAMDKDKRGIFAHAILNRQYEVFKLIYEIECQKGFKTSIDKFGNNLLHLAAELGPSFYHRQGSNAASIMQKELLWFKAVESIVPPMYKQAKNIDGLKPHELFTKNHEQLLNEGRQSVKETASSFTIVGTLIVAIMFAAAFTVPGGNDQNKGTPIFLGQKAFSVFIIADTLSLVASSSAVLIFTGILSSHYIEKDFSTTLPLKLLFGFYTIFLSVECMMCAFCAALALMLDGYNSIMVTTVAFSALPILVLYGTKNLLGEIIQLLFAMRNKEGFGQLSGLLAEDFGIWSLVRIIYAKSSSHSFGGSELK